MVVRNSKNCVACTIEYGIDDALISFSCASFARKYPLPSSRPVPTTDNATWCLTPAAASAVRTLCVVVLKNFMTAASSKDGEFKTSTTILIRHLHARQGSGERSRSREPLDEFEHLLGDFAPAGVDRQRVPTVRH